MDVLALKILTYIGALLHEVIACYDKVALVFIFSQGFEQLDFRQKLDKRQHCTIFSKVPLLETKLLFLALSRPL